MENILMAQLVNELEVQLYDVAVPDWPGEIDFYGAMATEVKGHAGSVLEVGCGTGRVTLQLAQGGFSIVGMDISPAMLSIARQKSQGLSNVSWVEDDMLKFDLGERFDLIIIPGHSFQFMLTPEDQLACLSTIRQHLAPQGKLVIHVNHDDHSWLGELAEGRGTDFKLKGEYRQNSTKGFVRAWTAWSYEDRTQTASAVDAWEFIGQDGKVTERKESAPKRLHVVFPFEMKHLLAHAGFELEALYGDFFRHELQNTSPDMIWVAHID
jgi:SAM-dependent methyltransferase